MWHFGRSAATRICTAPVTSAGQDFIALVARVIFYLLLRGKQRFELYSIPLRYKK